MLESESGILVHTDFTFLLLIFLSIQFTHGILTYNKTCVKRPLSKRPKISFQDQLSLYAGQKYCRMLQECSILLTFIKLPFVIKIFVVVVFSIFEWPFTQAFLYCSSCQETIISFIPAAKVKCPSPGYLCVCLLSAII